MVADGSLNVFSAKEALGLAQCLLQVSQCCVHVSCILIHHRHIYQCPCHIWVVGTTWQAQQQKRAWHMSKRQVYLIQLMVEQTHVPITARRKPHKQSAKGSYADGEHCPHWEDILFDCKNIFSSVPQFSMLSIGIPNCSLGPCYHFFQSKIKGCSRIVCRNLLNNFFPKKIPHQNICLIFITWSRWIKEVPDKNYIMKKYSVLQWGEQRRCPMNKELNVEEVALRTSNCYICPNERQNNTTYRLMSNITCNSDSIGNFLRLLLSQCISLKINKLPIQFQQVKIEFNLLLIGANRTDL